MEEALFYVHQTAMHNWARSLLIYHIDTDLYNRQGKVDNNFQTALPKPQSDLASDLLKNPYNFGFLMLSEDASERELENALINNLKKFLQELGHDFGFIAQQYHLQVSDQDYYIDLLFYHTYPTLKAFIPPFLKPSRWKLRNLKCLQKSILKKYWTTLTNELRRW